MDSWGASYRKISSIWGEFPMEDLQEDMDRDTWDVKSWMNHSPHVKIIDPLKYLSLYLQMACLERNQRIQSSAGGASRDHWTCSLFWLLSPCISPLKFPFSDQRGKPWLCIISCCGSWWPWGSKPVTFLLWVWTSSWAKWAGIWTIWFLQLKQRKVVERRSGACHGITVLLLTTFMTLLGKSGQLFEFISSALKGGD